MVEKKNALPTEKDLSTTLSAKRLKVTYKNPLRFPKEKVTTTG